MFWACNFSREKDGVEEGRRNKKKKILLYRWPPTGTHHKNIMIFWKFLLFLKLANLFWVIFFMGNRIFFRVEIWQMGFCS
jgi:hypothetical protein